jgi:hypothetical protein
MKTFFATIFFFACFLGQTVAQTEFKGQSFVTSKKNNDYLKKGFKAYKAYELNLVEIKKKSHSQE